MGEEAGILSGAADWLQIFMAVLYVVNLILGAFILFGQRREPKVVWSWLLVLFFLHAAGFLLYLFAGRSMKGSQMFQVKCKEDRKLYGRLEFQADSCCSQNAYQQIMEYHMETQGAVCTWDNQVNIFTKGEEKFKDLKEELSQARQFIHMQYYIIKDDQVFQELCPVLEERAKAGVEVRVLYDAMGGRFMPEKKWKRLRAKGILVESFFPAFLGTFHLKANYRNHRKLVVIDNKVGYVGGFNIGKEYISKDPSFGNWRDTHLKLEGSAVLQLQIRFALDWKYASGENLFLNMKYFASHPAGGGKVGIQIISGGPDGGIRQIRDHFIWIFYRARKTIRIQTPYFIPDDAVLTALQTAARCGVDVKLMIPCRPDHPLVYWATWSYMGDLLRAGARCYLYENGFLHAKGIMVDGQTSSYGTANMDIRSFELNFEVNAAIYDEGVTKRLEEVFDQDLNQCREITLSIYENRTLGIKVKEQLCRLFSPVL